MAVLPTDSFDEVLRRLRAGDEEAAAEIFRRFGNRLVGLARSRLDSQVRGKMDPEDVLQSVLRSFFVRQADGQFDLGDWDDLWSLLVRITVRKCGRRVAAFRAERRDVRREVRPDIADPTTRCGWEAMAQDPSPEEVVCLTDMLESLMRGLNATQREILRLRLQGCTVPEISDRVGRTERTVHRVLTLVRERLKRAEGDLAP